MWVQCWSRRCPTAVWPGHYLIDFWKAITNEINPPFYARLIKVSTAFWAQLFVLSRYKQEITSTHRPAPLIFAFPISPQHLHFHFTRAIENASREALSWQAAGYVCMWPEQHQTHYHQQMVPFHHSYPLHLTTHTLHGAKVYSLGNLNHHIRQWKGSLH